MKCKKYSFALLMPSGIFDFRTYIVAVKRLWIAINL
jgi:hypothetical protein